MFESPLKKDTRLRAVLIGVHRRGYTRAEAQEHLEELVRLAETMGLLVCATEMTSVMSPTPAFLFGKGKVEELKALAEAHEADLVVIDDDLSPAQQRNWEKETGRAVIDRCEVILDIFAQRAHTREARLQVELARLEYSLPRLKRAWTHLERQRGGGGFVGGAGEAQIEVDRRIVRNNIARVKRDLEAVRRQRATQRKTRLARPVPTASLVGYTNSGKSSLLNSMTGAGVLAEDKLFATLDPTTRRIHLPNSQSVLLTDTVGFIRKLPHMLVEAFKATLEEAQLADFLVHVVDASHPDATHQVDATDLVLRELGIVDKPVIFVLNKMDLVEDPIALADLRNRLTPHVLTSNVSGQGLAELADMMALEAERSMERVVLRIPPDRQDVVGYAYREGRVLARHYDEEVTVLEVALPEKARGRVAEFLAPEESTT